MIFISGGSRETPLVDLLLFQAEHDDYHQGAHQ
jgi:hypothetical protein